MASEVKRDRVRIIATGVILLAIALVPRLQALSHDFVDIVEFLTMIQPPNSTLADYLWRLWTVGPDQVPAYYVFTWGVRNIFGHSWLVTRFASMILMLSVLLMAWRVVANRFGAWAGFLTGLLIALSPADIYYAMQARSYSLVIFEAAFSIWTLVRAVETGDRKWLVYNVVINTLLPFTHLFGFLLIAAEGLWLLGLWYFQQPVKIPPTRRAWQAIWRGALWGSGHFMAILLALRWILKDTADTVPWYAPAPWRQFMTDILGDAQFFGNLFVYESSAGKPVFEFAAPAIRSSTDYWLATASDTVFGIGIIAALASSAWFVMRIDGKLRSILALLFITALLPPVALYIGAALTIPVALPRYTAYCNFPLYMLFGVGLARLPLRRSGYLLLAGVLASMGLLCITWQRVHPEVDWPGASKLVQRQPDPKARVFVISLAPENTGRTTLPRRMMQYSDPEGRERYWYAYTAMGLADACAAECARTGRVVYALDYGQPISDALEEVFLNELRRNGFLIDTKRHQYFRFYAISHPNPPQIWLQPADETGQRYLEILEPFLTDEEETPERTNAALRWAVQNGDNLTSPDLILRATFALLEISPILGRASARYLTTLEYREAPPPILELVLALEDENKQQMRVSAVEVSKLTGHQDYRPIVKALESGDIDLARETAQKWRFADGVHIPPILLQLLEIEPRLSYAAPITGGP